MTLEFRPFVPDRSHPTFRDGVRLMQLNFPDASATSPEFLDWLYLKNPYRKAIGYLCYDGETPVSQLFIIFQMARWQGKDQLVGIASNACTSPTHRKLGLFQKIFAMLMEDCRKMGIPFVWAYPNPSSLRGFQNTGFRVVKDVSLELTPVSYFSAAKDFLHKKTSILGETSDLPWDTGKLRGFHLVTELEETETVSDTWKIPLSTAQLRWRYLENPTRKYYALRHEKTGAVVVLRLFSLFGVRAAGVMKVSAVGKKQYRQLIKDLRPNLKGACSIFLSLGNLEWTAADLAHQRFRLPVKLSPRRFPLAIYPLRDMDLSAEKFEFSFGDYEAL